MLSPYDKWLLPKDQPELEAEFAVYENLRLTGLPCWVRIEPSDFDQSQDVDLDALLAACKEQEPGGVFEIRQVE